MLRHGLAVKNLPAMQETQEMWVCSLGREDLLEEEMSTHPSILAWKIPWTGIWRATVQRVSKSQTRMSTHIYNINKYIYIYFSCMRTLVIYLLGKFQVYSKELLTVATFSYIRIYSFCMCETLYPLTNFFPFSSPLIPW